MGAGQLARFLPWAWLWQAVQCVESAASLQVRRVIASTSVECGWLTDFVSQDLRACDVRGLCARSGARGQPRERSLLCGVLKQMQRPACMSVCGQQSALGICGSAACMQAQLRFERPVVLHE